MGWGGVGLVSCAEEGEEVNGLKLPYPSALPPQSFSISMTFSILLLGIKSAKKTAVSVLSVTRKPLAPSMQCLAKFCLFS